MQPHFKQAVVPCWQALLRLGRALLRSFALALGLDEHAWEVNLTHPDAAVAMNYYRPLAASRETTQEDMPVRHVSISSHTDFQLFTILWQDVVGGLQMLTRESQWLRARPIPGTFVVNFGDCSASPTTGF
jgi:isopenicillin N synthase-like dioxygenase